jgi:hypothetical protein
MSVRQCVSLLKDLEEQCEDNRDWCEELSIHLYEQEQVLEEHSRRLEELERRQGILEHQLEENDAADWWKQGPPDEDEA